MPTFEFTSPEGKTYEVEGPEGATQEQAFGMLQSQIGSSKQSPTTPTPLVAGNIDLNTRPRVKNDDGTVSTVRSIGVNVDGKEVLIPTISDSGKVLSDDQAVELYKRTGKHLGIFRTPAESTTYAQKLHEDEAAKLAAKSTLKQRLIGDDPLKELGAGFGRLPAETANLLDMGLSIFGQAIGVGGDLGMRAIGSMHGFDNKTVGLMGQKFRQELSEPLTNPLQKIAGGIDSLMQKFGHAPYAEKAYEKSQIHEVMGKVGELVQQGGDKVEKATGGLLTSADVDTFTQILTLGLGAKGLKQMQPKLNKLGRVSQDQLPTLTDKQKAAEAPKTEARPKPVVNAAKIDELLGIPTTKERVATTKARREDVKKAVADDPDLADYYAAKADERARQVEIPQPERGVVEENFPQTKETLPDVPPDVMIADALGNVAKTPKELAILNDPGTQAAIAAYQAKKNQPGYGVMKGQRGAADFGAHEDMVKFLQDLGFDDPKALASRMLASVDEAKTAVQNNASGESAASLEAQGRLASEKAAGQTRLLVDRDGTVRPLVGVDAVDQVAKPGQVILQKGVGKDEWTTLSKGADIGGAGEARAKAAVASQRGIADPKDLAKLAAVAGGAVVGSQLTDDPLFGAITGAAFTAGAGYLAPKGAKPGLEAAVKGLDYVGGNLSTRIGNISQPILRRAREYERGVLERTHKLLDRAHPFIEQLSKVKGEKGEVLARAILTNDRIAVKEALDAVGNPKLTSEFRNVQAMLEEVGKELQAHGRLGTLRENYFPRVVKDLDGLMTSLGTEVRTKLQKDLAAAEIAALRTGQQLSDLDRTVIVNRSLLSMGDALKGKPGFSKARQIDAVTKELQPFYATPVESLHSYLSQASKDLEKAKFFGRDLVKAEGKVDLEASIGKVVARELDVGNITFAQAEELGSMLRSRFGPGEASSSALIQDVKNMVNAGLLGNVVSAATQLGDVGTTVAIQGLRPTMESVVRQLTGRNRINLKDFGLADHVSEEFVSTRKSAKFLNSTFKLGLFTAVDAFGKDVGLNAAHLKLRDLTKTVGGMRKLEAKYSDAFGQDFPALVQELRSGKLGDQTKAALFSELSDMQPISRLEVPQAYLDMPNGRTVYMLKTFMLKQFDIARREGYNEIKKGNVATGIKNLTRYALALGASGAATDMIRQWLMGQTVDFNTNDVSKNILKTFGWSEYVLDQAKKGEPVKAVGGALLPPYQMFDDLYKAAGGGTMSEASREKARAKVAQYIPVVGKLVESHLLGGAERRDAQEAKRKEKAQ